MRKVFFILFLALFAITFFVKAYPSNAQEAVVETETPIGVEEKATESSKTLPQRVNYELPYPGILPDSPFYFLKVIRDGIVKLLINEDMKMARFSLENAEKRMYAGKLLIDKSKDELALSTISKSNNYLDDAMRAVMDAKKKNSKNPDIRSFLLQTRTAIAKHIEIIMDQRIEIDSKYSAYLTSEEKRLKNTQKTVESLLRTK